jgi:hypothetical protein
LCGAESRDGSRPVDWRGGDETSIREEDMDGIGGERRMGLGRREAG